MRTTKIITDPIYQEMSFGSDPEFIKVFKQVIDTKVFQRLRRITQLGLASYVFPGATHTKFSHSLGVAYLARTVLLHSRKLNLLLRSRQRKPARLQWLPFFMTSGTRPFSHSFERVLNDVKGAPNHEESDRALNIA